MKKVTVIILIILMSNNLFASKNYSVIIDGLKKGTFNTITLNNTDYIDLQLISNLFFQGTKTIINKFEIIGENNHLTFSPSSMFVKFISGKESSIFQMRQPTVYYQKRLLVPINSFLLALELLSIYKVDNQNGIINLQYFREAQPNELLKFEDNNIFSELKKELNSENINEDKEQDKIIGNSNLEDLNKDEPIFFDEDDNYIIPNETRIIEIDSIIHEMDRVINSQSDLSSTINPNSSIINDSIKITNKIIYPLQQNSSINIDLLKSGIEYNKEIIKTEISHLIDTIQVNNNNQQVFSQSEIPEKIEPNIYSLPRNLNRGDLSKDYGQVLLADSKNETRYERSNNVLDSKLQIIKIYAEKKSDNTEIHLYSNFAIENYQKPECNGKSMIIRIPDASDRITDYTMINKIFPIKKISSEIVRNILVYTIQFSTTVKDCKSKRIGPKEIVYTVYPIDMKESTVLIQEEIKIEKKENIIDPVKGTTKKESLNLDNHKKKWNLDVIVIDPGHGGHDVGAVGVTGVYEKDITLKLARKVKELLSEAMPETKAILTREDDRFIELYKRGQIANQSGGKLFISIHLNSANKKPSAACGIETYILRPGRNDDAIRVANFENSVIKFEKQQDMYKHLNDEQIIIATMAQSAFVQFSEKLAKHIQEEVIKTTKLEDRGVKQAGFYVLVGASMPNILFEASFLSNPDDEKFVNSINGQEKIAIGIVNAIKKYSEEYIK